MPQARPLGFYEAAYSGKEVAGLIDQPDAQNLNGELTVARLAVRHALLQLNQQLTPAEYVRIVTLIFKGVRTIAEIMHVQRPISPGQDNLPPPWIASALDRISAETGLNL